MKNIFELSLIELKIIANRLERKIEEGLTKNRMEIACIPTYITPSKNIANGKVLALDWGGTNFRAAIVEFEGGKIKILEIVKDEISAKTLKEQNIKTQESLFAAMAKVISGLETLDKSVTSIGYCFSYPAQCQKNGDAVLLEWAKNIYIEEMLKKTVGRPLLQYLNKHLKTNFKKIKVINDTVACLFAGLDKPNYDNYIGLIVGTGTNMAALMHRNKIGKLNDKKNADFIPVNLESGNFNPQYLLEIDDLVDSRTKNKGVHRFEKAISGLYLCEIFKIMFKNEKFKADFNGKDLSKYISDKDNSDHCLVATWIAQRSAKLVAASIAGLVQVLVRHNPKTKKIGLAADGAVFWETPGYEKWVSDELKKLLPKDIKIKIFREAKEPNLVGSAIGALS